MEAVVGWTFINPSDSDTRAGEERLLPPCPLAVHSLTRTSPALGMKRARGAAGVWFTRQVQVYESLAKFGLISLINRDVKAITRVR